MAMRDHMPPGISQRGRLQIVTVDPPTRRIEGHIKDGSMIQVAVWEIPAAFRWPIEGEVWTIYKDTGIWMLGARVQDGMVNTDDDGIRTKETEANPVENLSPGDMKLDGSIVTDVNGLTFVAVDLTGIANGWTLKWSATLKRFVASP